MATQVPTRGQNWRPEAETFGARLALLRHRLGVTNVAAAARLYGFDEQSYRNWESDKRCADIVGVATRISEVTGVDIQWLVFGPEPGLSGQGGWPFQQRNPLAVSSAA